MTKGCSTGMPPIQVKMSTLATKAQKRNCVTGRNVSPRCLDVWRKGTSIRTRMEASRASTPPSLLGIERRMAYANRKYHSGLMWGGVTRGLAGTKLSGSPRRLGEKRARQIRATSISVKPSRSL